VSELLELIICSEVGHLDIWRYGYCRRCHLLAGTDRAVGNDGAASSAAGPRVDLPATPFRPGQQGAGAGLSDGAEVPRPLPGPEIDN
jgi:hypothetical protein